MGKHPRLDRQDDAQFPEVQDTVCDLWVLPEMVSATLDSALFIALQDYQFIYIVVINRERVQLVAQHFTHLSLVFISF